MVEQLNKDAVRIAKIERSCSITVRFDWLGQCDTARFNPRSDKVDILRPANDKSDVMYGLNGTGILAVWQLMDGQVIAPRC
jgi:hypothetical protein